MDPLAVELTFAGVASALQDFRNLTAAANKLDAVQKRLTSTLGKSRQALTNLPAVLQAAQVSVSTPGSANVSTSGNRLKIDVTVNGGRSEGAASGSSNPRSARSRYLPGNFRPATGPRQRRDVLTAAIQSGQISGSALADTVDAVERIDRQLEPKPRTLPTGRRQRLAKLDDDRAYALSIGNFNAFDDLHEQHTRLSRQMNGPEPGSKLLSAILTSRFAAGKAQPLVGRTLNVLGGTGGILEKFGPQLAAAEAALAKFGPAGIAIGLVATVGMSAATSLFQVASSAAEASNNFNQLAMATGGSTSENARLQATGTALGMSPSEISGIAQSIQQAITSSPIGAAIGQRLGVYNIAGPFGNQDYAGQALKVIDSLRAIKDPEERLRMARGIGNPDLARVASLSDKQYSKIAQDANVRSRIMTPEMAQQSADFQAAMGRLGDAFTNLETAIGSRGIDLITRGVNSLADTINGAALIVDAAGPKLAAFIATIGSVITDLSTGNVLGLAADALSFKGQADSGLATALKSNTQATAANTAAMATPGQYGNVTRPGAMPQSAMNSRNAQDMTGLLLSTI